MRRVPIILLLAVTMGGVAASITPSIAAANTCSNTSGSAPRFVEPYELGDDGQAASCASRWYVTEKYQYESGGSWYIPNNGPIYSISDNTAGGDPTYCTHNDYNLVGEFDCWGTNDGSGGGYFGAGNFRNWSMYELYSGLPCIENYRWRIVDQIKDYATNNVIATITSTTPAGSC